MSVNNLVYEFGSFSFAPAEGLLRRAGEPLDLQPKTLQILQLLLERRGEVVTKDEFLERVWPDIIVEEGSLAVQISYLRKILGENATNEKYIVTAPRRGYRFVAAVTEKSSRDAATGPGLASDTAKREVNVAAPTLPAPRRVRFWPLVFLAGGLLSVALAFGLYGFAQRRPAAGPDFAAMKIDRVTEYGNLMDATLSPDAQIVAYVPRQAGKQSLWLHNRATNEKLQLLPPDPALCWGLKFSHDGSQLFYVKTQPNSTINVLYRISVSGGAEQKIVVNIDSPATLSPDGMQLAFVRSLVGPGQHRDILLTASIDGSGEKEIATRRHPEKFSFSTPSWSPDGKFIALGFSTNSQLDFTLLGVPVNGGASFALTPQHWYEIGGLAWEDDGEHLVFSARAADSRTLQIWRLQYPNGAPQRITNDTNNYLTVNLSKDPRALLTMQTGRNRSLWLTPLDKNAAPQRFNTGREDEAPGSMSVSQDGRIFYNAAENGLNKLWSVDATGRDAKLLSDNSSLPQVSRDGRFVVFVASRNGHRHILRIAADGTQEKQLTNGGGENDPYPTPDGQWILFTALSGERNTIWKVPLEGGEPTQLTRGSLAFAPIVSPDGAKFACKYRADEADKWKIAVFPIEGGTPLKVFPFPDAYHQTVRWTPDGKSLAYLETHDGAENIWLQPLEAGASKQISGFAEGQIFSFEWLEENRLIVSQGAEYQYLVLIKKS